MKKIIVSVDGSSHSLRAIQKAKEISQAFDSHIILINAIDNIHYYNFETQIIIYDEFNELEASRRRSKILLEKSKESLKDIEDRVETVTLEGDPSHVIIEYINASDADLVIIGSHGVKGIKRFMLGSLVSKVVHQSEKNVLIVR